MPNLTTRDTREAMQGTDAHRIYGELETEWLSFTAGHQALILLVRELFWRADLATIQNGLHGGTAVFCGGHVELADEAAFYSLWKSALLDKQFEGGKRISSHSSTEDQYEIALPKGWGTLLFGVRNGGTWFQNEAYPITTGLGDYLGHVGTTISYGGSKIAAIMNLGSVKNIGAKGKSTLDDKNPLRLAVIADLDDLLGRLSW